MEEIKQFKHINPIGKQFLCKVPNNEEGKKAIQLIKKGLNNKSYRIRLRGRHSNRKKLYAALGWCYNPNTQNDVPIKYAETISVYVDIRAKSVFIGTNKEATRENRHRKNKGASNE